MVGRAGIGFRPRLRALPGRLVLVDAIRVTRRPAGGSVLAVRASPAGALSRQRPAIALAAAPRDQRALIVSSFVLPHTGGIEQFVDAASVLLSQRGWSVRILACRPRRGAAGGRGRRAAEPFPPARGLAGARARLARALGGGRSSRRRRLERGPPAAAQRRSGRRPRAPPEGRFRAPRLGCAFHDELVPLPPLARVALRVARRPPCAPADETRLPLLCRCRGRAAALRRKRRARAVSGSRPAARAARPEEN